MPDTIANSLHETPQPVAALILAAGGATRMGSPKALLPWRGTTLLGHCVEVALASRCDEVWVMVGAHGQQIERAICETGVEVMLHDRWQEGMGTTIAAAVQELGSRLGGLLILPCDQPFITPELLDALLPGRSAEEPEIAASGYGGTVGAPAFFPRSAFPQLATLSGDRGAKALLVQDLERIAVVDFPLGAFDIDTREDYARALEELARREDTQ